MSQLLDSGDSHSLISVRYPETITIIVPFLVSCGNNVSHIM